MGRGSLAGPMVVCSALVPAGWMLEGLNDSKKLTRKQRAKLHVQMGELIPFIRFFPVWVWPEEIDLVGLGRAHVRAIETSIRSALEVQPDADVIVDGNLRLNVKHTSIPGADGFEPAVMAASVHAKEVHDLWMRTNAEVQHPGYDFASNMGYRSEKHIRGLDTLGVSPIHRKSFKPISDRFQAAQK